jgi:hypothetical protein
MAAMTIAVAAARKVPIALGRMMLLLCR